MKCRVQSTIENINLLFCHNLRLHSSLFSYECALGDVQVVQVTISLVHEFCVLEHPVQCYLLVKVTYQLILLTDFLIDRLSDELICLFRSEVSLVELLIDQALDLFLLSVLFDLSCKL